MRLKAGSLQYSDGAGETAIDETTGEFAMPASDITVLAEFEAVPGGYAIYYMLDGGTASGNPTTYTAASADITLVNPTANGIYVRRLVRERISTDIR